MYFFLCTNTTQDFSLHDLADIANVIIAAANIFLASYIFLYQIKKDRKSEFATAKLNEQNIKLQWFKELIVQPNMTSINNYFNNLNSIKEQINLSNLTKDEKERINEFVKTESSIFRKSFIDVILQVDKAFGIKFQTNIDNLVDSITNAIFNDQLNLKLPADYEKYIGSKISYEKNNLISMLYNYKGLS